MILCTFLMIIMIICMFVCFWLFFFGGGVDILNNAGDLNLQKPVKNDLEEIVTPSSFYGKQGVFAF